MWLCEEEIYDPYEAEGYAVQAAYENYIEKQYDEWCQRGEEEYYKDIENLIEYESYKVGD